ncbi:energy transducer TonB [Paramagnetospirillum kuznetsovii]|uniref:Energy transducer TonB n=1 Tax=Paramagnetospirillum kuznetsovii TaxID=2053833 RepID=A0A364NXD1_9PROT|nr:energy transducer TonB [Paramagnetospirillum kuznetsovii]RAU21567.1 energy transducer TonB [Paramagnetospirillum kuznetsovii]
MREWGRESSLNWGLALSLLLHVLFWAASQIESLPDLSIHLPEPAMEVDLVREEPKPPPPPPPPPPPQEPPKPPPSKVEPPARDPVPVPQLRPGKLAEKAAAPKQAAPSPGVSFEKAPPPTVAVGEMTQTAQDMVLAQVLKMWNFDTEPAKGTNFTISMSVIVNKDGTLADALHKNAPWNPQLAIRGYDRINDGYVKRAMESMLLALRLAQPLALPPDDGKGWPRRMVIRFRPGDL